MKKSFLAYLGAIILASSIVLSGEASAADNNYPKEIDDYTDPSDNYTGLSDDTYADDWFTKPSDGKSSDKKNENDKEKEDEDKSDKNQKKDNDEKKALSSEKERFIWLFNDGNFSYFLDTQGVNWKRMPYSTREYIADVWIRMVPLMKSLMVGEDGDIEPTYYLEHYYLRPQRKQIQFLCELEVTGRPQNAISEREYSPNNWENLIPGSIEDEIYRTVLKKIGTAKSNADGHMTFVDYIDEYLRIGLN